MRIVEALRLLLRRTSKDQAIEDELRTHLEMRTADNVASGMSAAGARRDALLRLGNPAVLKERILADSGIAFASGFFRDVRYALRQLARNRGFATASILTFALGIGLSTAAFSILNAWILRPLPLGRPQQLVMLWRSSLANPDQPAYFFNWRDYLFFRNRNHAFQSLGASFERSYALTGSGAPQSLSAEVASASLFPTLGIRAYRGRFFLPADQSGPGVAVISHVFWSQHFHESPDALGQTLILNDKPFKIVGVLPPGFSYRVLDQPNDAAVWTLIQAGSPDYQTDSSAPVALVARLRPGVTIAKAQSEIAVLQKLSDQRYTDVPKTTALVSSLQEDNTRLLRGSLFVLCGAVGLLMLIVCTNVASLILGRNARRERELAIRAALGSSMRRLFRQLATESLVLFGLGGILGLVLAYVFVRGFISWNPFGVLPASPIAVNLPVLGAAAALTALSGMMFGAYPAFQQMRKKRDVTLSSAIASGVPHAGKMRSRRALVILQIACSVVLLVGCDLLLATFFKLNGQPLGFQPSNSYVLQLSLPHRHYPSDEQIARFTNDLLPRLRGLPGLRSAAMTVSLRLADAGSSPFRVESQAANPNHLPQAVQEIVSPGYFEAMGIPILDGRGFRESDRKDTVPVAILNEEAVHRYFGGRSPLGEHIRIGEANDPTDPSLLKGDWLEIVGVAASTESVRYNQLAWLTRPEIYTDYRQQPIEGLNGSNTDYTGLTFIMRTGPGISLSEDSVRQAVWKTDAELPVAGIRPLGEMVAALQAQPRVRARLLTLFSSLTLLLAAIGIYGVIAQWVTQRFREIGVRMALGADRGGVARLVLRQAALLTATGIAIGWLVAFLVVRLMRGLLYEIAPGNPMAYLAVAIVVLAVALLAGLLPARRAASIDPMTALRSE